MTKTQEDRFSRDISEIKKALQSIAKDLNYFRKKDEAAAVVEEKEEPKYTCDEAAAVVEEKEEPKYTCKDCTMYQRVIIAEPNDLAHWCTLHCCTISDEGLEEICDNFERNW